MGRRLHHACGPGARTQIQLITSTSNRRGLQHVFSRLRHTPGRLTLLVGCIRLSNILKSNTSGRISGGRLLRHTSTSPTVFGKLMRGRVFRICCRRVKQLGHLIKGAMRLGILGRRRRQTCRRVVRDFRRGGIYLLRKIASDKGARMCVRLVRRALERNERILCLLPRVTLAARVARQLGQIFNSQLKVCRSGFPSTREMRV